MTISDLMQKYKILMYPNFWPIIFYLFIFLTLQLFFHIWAPAPEELSAHPCTSLFRCHRTRAILRIKNKRVIKYKVK